MSNKPTYDELSQRVRELESNAADLKNIAAYSKESEQIYRYCFENANIGVCLVDPDGNFIVVNNRMVEIFGYSQKEFEAMNVDDVSHPEDKVISKEIQKKAKIGKIENSVFQKRYIHKKGHIFWGKVSNSVVRDHTGNPLYFVTHFIDATEDRYTFEKFQEHQNELESLVNERTKELSESQETLRTVIDNSPFPVGFADVNNEKILYWSKSALEKFGHNPKTVSEWYELAYPDPQYRKGVIHRWNHFLEKALKFKKTINAGEYHIVCKDGTVKICEIYAQFIPGYLIVTLNDITEHKQAEDKLRLNEWRYKSAQRMGKVGNWEYDLTTETFWGSDQAKRIFGFDPEIERLTTDEVENCIPERDRVHQALIDLIKTGTPYNLKFDIQPISGAETRTVRSIAELIRDETGSPLKVSGVIQDITEQKKADEKLASLERRNRSLLDHSPVCHKIVDLDLNLQYMNARGYKMLKVDEKDNLYGKPYPFDFFPESSRNTLTEKLHEVKKSGRVIDFESIACDAEGNNVWLHHSIIPVQDNDANIEYITVVSADITEQKHLQERMRQSEKMESVGRLAGGVAHDFNNMLSVIIGHTEMVMENLEKDSFLFESLEEIRNAGKRSADLTGQLLAFARKQVISPKTLNINKTVEGSLKILRRLIGEDIDLTFTPSKKNWPVRIDPVQIDQILTNLCVNSRDAIKDVGKIFIEIDTVVFDEFYCSHHPVCIPGEYVLLAVSDNGSGIDKKTLSNIFEPFFTTKDFGQGTGLGLATVYGVVKQNRGFVNVYSEPGQGTTFKIYLPRYREKGESHSNKLKNIQIVKGHETILLVEDEPAILNLTVKMLERFGYQVLAANSPGEAIRLAQEYNGVIHLLITDVIMPEMNGRNLAKNILSIYPDLKRLFMSGYSANVIAHHGVLDDGVNFIQKPFTREQLGVKIREALEQNES